jgi:uncharacterized membrane-anchored protein YjiN (DUF445 family)
MQAIEQQIARYDRDDARLVSAKIRAIADSDIAFSEIVELYEEVLRDYRQRNHEAGDEQWRAAARYIRRLQADFAFHSALTMRWRNRLLRLPLTGSLVSLRQRLKRH